MKLETIKRKDGGRENFHFYAYGANGKKYSILDIGTLMETDTSYSREQWEKMWANTWESAEVKENGEIDSDTIQRASSWEELQKLLT